MSENDNKQLELKLGQPAVMMPQAGSFEADGLHVMIDLETMSLGWNAAIIAIGAVMFDPLSTRLGSQFYCAIDLASSQMFGLDINASTVSWWMNPEFAAARDRWYAEPKHDLINVLDGFAQWIGPTARPVWGNGAAFDNVVIRNAYQRVGMMAPWTYKHDRCCRTIYNMNPFVEQVREGPLHHALYDAISQAKTLQMCFNNMGTRVVG